MDLAIGFGLALLMVAGGGVLVLWRDGRSTENRVQALERQSKELLAQLEGKRHTENTTAAMEDALAVLMRLSVEEQQQAIYRDAWVQRAQAILQTARQGPRAYQVDQPTGNRVRFKGDRQ